MLNPDEALNSLDHRFLIKGLSLKPEALPELHLVLASEAYQKEAAFERIADLLETGADFEKVERQLRQFIRQCPSHMEARLVLAELLLEGSEEADERYLEGLQWLIGIWQSGIALIMEASQELSQQLVWDIPENQTYLQAVALLATELDFREKFEQAIPLYYYLLKLDPEDHHGVRASLVDALLICDVPNEALEICKMYPEDGTVDLLYGKALAHHMLDQKNEAMEALKVAFAFRPLVARYLLATNPTAPPNYEPGEVRFGGEDEAYSYYEELGFLWEAVEGAKTFLREGLRYVNV